MTRYTFAILLCRVIGILSVLSLLETWYLSVNLFSLLDLLRPRDLKWYEGIPIPSLALALAIPIGGCVVGLCAKSIADRVQSPVDRINNMLVWAITAAITWSIIVGICQQLGVDVCFRWASYGGIGGSSDNDLLNFLASRFGRSMKGISYDVWKLAAAMAVMIFIVWFTIQPRVEEIEE